MSKVAGQNKTCPAIGYMGLIVQSFVNAGIISCIYALMSVGLALVFGVMGILNFAHGELYMVGAYTLWIVYAQAGMPFPVGVIAAMAIVCGLAIAMERGLFRPMRDRPFTGVLLSIGVSFILQVFTAQMWGMAMMRHVPPALKGSLEILGIFAPWQRLIVIPGALGMLGGLWYFLYKVKAGQALRAAAQDREAAALQGISIDRSAALAMGIGGALAAFAGAAVAPILPVTPYMGHSAVITAFIILILGGVGSLKGALIASFILGFLHTFVTTYVDGQMATIAGALLMFTVLVFKPRGIMGRG